MNYNFTSVFCLQFEEQQFGRDTCGRNLPQLAREQEGGGGGGGAYKSNKRTTACSVNCGSIAGWICIHGNKDEYWECRELFLVSDLGLLTQFGLTGILKANIQVMEKGKSWERDPIPCIKALFRAKSVLRTTINECPTSDTYTALKQWHECYEMGTNDKAVTAKLRQGKKKDHSAKFWQSHANSPKLGPYIQAGMHTRSCTAFPQDVSRTQSGMCWPGLI